MTNLGPLTTIFTPSGPDCSSTFDGHILQSSYRLLRYGTADNSSVCLPRNFNPRGAHYYSPGICPLGYISACYSEISSSIIATCCPVNYTCKDQRGDDDEFGCWSWFGGPKAFTMSAFDFETDAEGSTTTVSSWSTSVTLTKNWVHAYGPIVHAMADNTLSVIPTPGSSPTASLSDYEGRKATVTVTMIPGEGPGTDTTAGLSTEAAAVVGVGSVIIVMLSIAAAVFLCRRRRKGLKRNWGVGWVAPTQAPHIPEQEYETQHRRQHALELSTERHQRFPYELEAERGV